MKRLLVAGMGLIGLRHVHEVMSHTECELVGIIDPDPACRAQAPVPGYADFDAVDIEADGIIIATPTQLHAAHVAKAVDRGWHMLIEKPVAGTLADADHIVALTDGKNLATLVGHHRRYHASVQHLRTLVQTGGIGVPRLASLIWAVRKPDTYFKDNWRSGDDGSPVMINLVHDIDLLRFIFGEVVQVQGMGNASLRGTSRVESGVVTLGFASGLVASITFGDTCPSPWGFEAGTGENPNIATTGQDMLFVMGSEGSVSFPSLTHWTGSRDWGQAPIAATLDVAKTTPLTAQLDHFCAVIDGDTTPLIDATTARQTLAVALQVQHVVSQFGWAD